MRWVRHLAMGLLLCVLAGAGTQPRLAHAQNLQQIHARAEAGDSVAQTYLGLAYDLGEGVSQDRHVAASWYRKAAEQDIADAQLYLAALLLEAEATPENGIHAHMWLEVAMDRLGDAQRVQAQRLLARAKSALQPGEVDQAERLAAQWRLRRVKAP